MAIFDQLNTGMSGQTFGNEEESPVKDEAIAEQQLELQKLLPSVAAIIDTLNAEIAAVSDIRAYITSLGPKPTADAIKDEYRARELFIEMVQRLQVNIANKVADVEQS